MAEQRQVTSISGRPITVRRTAEYKTYYANQSRMRISPSDFQMFFGILADEPGVDSIFNDEIFSVILAPQHAKVLARGLATVIEAYELQFGEIKLPEDAQKQSQSIRTEVMDLVKEQMRASTTKPHG